MKLIYMIFTWGVFICVSCVVRGGLSLFGLVVEFKNDLKRGYYGRHKK
jgi:hypothetical protein